MGLLALGAVPADAQALRLAAMGDSLTQGYGLPQEEGFVPVLEDWLQGRGHEVQITNAGVSGDTTAGGAARIDWTLAEDPDAMIVALGGNDLLRGIDPASSRANLDAILQSAGAAGVPVLLAGLPAPGNYGPDFKRDFEAMYVDLAAQHDAILVPDFLGPIGEKATQGLSLSDLMQEDRIHPNAEGVRQIVEAIGPQVEDLLARASGPADQP
ncbi:arylesterase (plasmid) [Paracoccus liaowanqingii]|uniref:Arylesterase n=1 Tax=Paracoccus liaowanqingii TaxID=2560053 RepID=A0A4Y5SUS4_9RHOB|nr:arylesterase [Paracoccus liaowanqingii]QDA36713.1 arylesterase [Paracoccus liaowanqingii]